MSGQSPSPLSSFVSDLSNALVPVAVAEDAPDRMEMKDVAPAPVVPQARIPWYRKALEHTGGQSDLWKLKQYCGDISNLHSAYWDQIYKTVSIDVWSHDDIKVLYEDGKPECPPEIQHLYKKLELKFCTPETQNIELDPILSKLAYHIKIFEVYNYSSYNFIKREPLEQNIMKFINLKEVKFGKIGSKFFDEVEGLLRIVKSKTIIAEIRYDHEDILEKILKGKLCELSNLQWIFGFYFYRENDGGTVSTKTLSLIASKLMDKVKLEICFGAHLNCDLDLLGTFVSDHSNQIKRLEFEHLFLKKDRFQMDSEKALKNRLSKLSLHITDLSIFNNLEDTFWNLMSADVKFPKLIKLCINFWISGPGPLTLLTQTPELQELTLEVGFTEVLESYSSEEQKKLIKQYFNEDNLPKLRKLKIKERDKGYYTDAKPFFEDGNELDLCLRSGLPFTKLEYDIFSNIRFRGSILF